MHDLYGCAAEYRRRTVVEKLKVEEAIAYGSEHELPMEHVIVHAPYIINLANTLKPETYELGRQIFCGRSWCVYSQIGAARPRAASGFPCAGRRRGRSGADRKGAG